MDGGGSVAIGSYAHALAHGLGPSAYECIACGRDPQYEVHFDEKSRMRAALVCSKECEQDLIKCVHQNRQLAKIGVDVSALDDHLSNEWDSEDMARVMQIIGASYDADFDRQRSIGVRRGFGTRRCGSLTARECGLYFRLLAALYDLNGNGLSRKGWAILRRLDRRRRFSQGIVVAPRPVPVPVPTRPPGWELMEDFKTPPRPVRPVLSPTPIRRPPRPAPVTPPAPTSPPDWMLRPDVKTPPRPVLRPGEGPILLGGRSVTDPRGVPFYPAKRPERPAPVTPPEPTSPPGWKLRPDVKTPPRPLVSFGAGGGLGGGGIGLGGGLSINSDMRAGNDAIGSGIQQDSFVLFQPGSSGGK